MTHRGLSIIALVGLVSGCALTSKSEPLVPRFFTPDSPGATGAPVQITSGGDATNAARPQATELRIGRVVAASHLREKMAYRTTSHELGFYEEARWTERPDVYVRRALERTLFESGAFTHVLSGEAPTLDVELLGFEEVRAKNAYAELTLRVVLTSDRTARWEETISVREPLSGKGGDALAGAMARALVKASAMVADRTRLAFR